MVSGKFCALIQAEIMETIQFSQTGRGFGIWPALCIRGAQIRTKSDGRSAPGRCRVENGKKMNANLNRLVLFGGVAALSLEAWAVASVGAKLQDSAQDAKASAIESTTTATREAGVQVMPLTANQASHNLHFTNLEVVTVTEVIASVEPDLKVESGTNLVTLTGAEEDIRMATKLINGLDAPDLKTNEIKCYPLKYASAGAMEDVIRVLLADRPTGDEMQEIRIFPLKYISGKMLGPSLKRGLDSEFSKNDHTNVDTNRFVAVAVDERSNSLIVSVPSTSMPYIEDYIQLVDQPRTNMADALPAFRFLPLRKSNNVAKGREPDQPKKGVDRIFTFSEPRAQKLVVSASDEIMPMIEDLIRLLDLEVEAQPGGSTTNTNVNPARGF
jgi:type II secretory pathway component GspD/PulD (secretin)